MPESEHISEPSLSYAQRARQRWLGVLSRARCEELQHALAGLPHSVTHSWIRPPEVGAVMIGARSGGTGERFNLGEMTVTRCALKLDSGEVGYGYVAGRDGRHAELIATFDALLQKYDDLDLVLDSLERARDERDRARLQKTNATKVDFFTLERGHV